MEDVLVDSSMLEDALSLERFARYLAWADGSRSGALELYALNTRLSEALYTPLQMLEVALRNRIHSVLAAAWHPRWFEDAGLLTGTYQSEQVATALLELARDGKESTPGRVVAALTFSFWTSMLGTAYENLWQQELNVIARRDDGRTLRRKDLSGPLTPIRLLRNRIAHHEPILEWNLRKHHETMRIHPATATFPAHGLPFELTGVLSSAVKGRAWVGRWRLLPGLSGAGGGGLGTSCGSWPSWRSPASGSTTSRAVTT